MGQITSEMMKNSGINLGTLVEFTLKKDAIFNLQTTPVPSYHAPKEDKGEASEIVYAGYVIELNDKYIGIIPGFDNEKKDNPEPGHIGGVNIDLDAIHSYAN